MSAAPAQASAAKLTQGPIPRLVLNMAAPHRDWHDVWVLSIATTALQAVISLTLLRREFSRKLG